MTWHVWTDGSCQHGYAQVPRGALGWGGWCAIVEHGSDGQVLRGRVEKTTNTRMEIMAATQGLGAVPDGGSVILHTDSTVLISIRDWALGNASGSTRDRKYWNDFAAQLRRLNMNVGIDLLGRGVRDPVHRRAHSIAGAEARGGLRNLPVNATPLEEGHHRIRQGMRRVQSRQATLGVFDTGARLLHARDCEVGKCVRSCPVWLQFGPALR